DVHADVVGVELAVPLRPGNKFFSEEPWKYGRELLDARLEVVDDHDRLVFLRSDFAAHALEAAGARLEVGDADDVLVGHPQREMSRDLGGELLISTQERLHPLFVQPHIPRALIVLQSLFANTK